MADIKHGAAIRGTTVLGLRRSKAIDMVATTVALTRTGTDTFELIQSYGGVNGHPTPIKRTLVLTVGNTLTLAGDFYSSFTLR